MSPSRLPDVTDMDNGAPANFYEVRDGDDVTTAEKPWLLHWYTQSGFSELATGAGLGIEAILTADGQPAAADADEVAFWLRAVEH